MIFSGLPFLFVFLPLFLLLFALCPKAWRLPFLCLAGALFYLSGLERGQWWQALLLAASALWHYVWAMLLAPRRRASGRRPAVVFGLCLCLAADVGLLAYFKTAQGGAGLPLGLSFYTFAAMAYALEVYRGNMAPVASLPRMALQLAYFPKLLSGPLENPVSLDKSLGKLGFSWQGLQEGLMRLTVGLASKALLASPLYRLWNEVSTLGYASLSTPLAWLGLAAFSLQLYFDFLGYSLMAQGLALMMGVELADNFRHPYAALGVRDFYRRWHISLGRFFNYYIYRPLGGSQSGLFRWLLSLAVVWLLTGLWHGVGWNYLLWAGLLLALIVVERLAAYLGDLAGLALPVWMLRIWTWFWIAISWMCFAITDLGDLTAYCNRLFGLDRGVNVRGGDFLEMGGVYLPYLLAGIFFAAPLWERCFLRYKSRFWFRLCLAALFWLAVSRVMAEGENIFMYSTF